MKAFAIKYKDQYCIFGSYRSVRLTSDPVKASLYFSRARAESRLAGVAFVNAGRDVPTIYIENPRTDESISVVELEFALLSESPAT